MAPGGLKRATPAGHGIGAHQPAIQLPVAGQGHRPAAVIGGIAGHIGNAQRRSGQAVLSLHRLPRLIHCQRLPAEDRCRFFLHIFACRRQLGDDLVMPLLRGLGPGAFIPEAGAEVFRHRLGCSKPARLQPRLQGTGHGGAPLPQPLQESRLILPLPAGQPAVIGGSAQAVPDGGLAGIIHIAVFEGRIRAEALLAGGVKLPGIHPGGMLLDPGGCAERLPLPDKGEVKQRVNLLLGVAVHLRHAGSHILPGPEISRGFRSRGGQNFLEGTGFRWLRGRHRVRHAHPGQHQQDNGPHRGHGRRRHPQPGQKAPARPGRPTVDFPHHGAAVPFVPLQGGQAFIHDLLQFILLIPHQNTTFPAGHGGYRWPGPDAA